jgi:hypothetical protein
LRTAGEPSRRQYREFNQLWIPLNPVVSF